MTKYEPTLRMIHYSKMEALASEELCDKSEGLSQLSELSLYI